MVAGFDDFSERFRHFQDLASVKIYSPWCPDLFLWIKFAESLTCLRSHPKLPLEQLTGFFRLDITEVHDETVDPLIINKRAVIRGFLDHFGGFLDFTIKFLKTLDEYRSDNPTASSVISQADLVDFFFCSSIVKNVSSCNVGENFLHMELKEMVIYLINTPVDFIEQDERKWDVAEMKEMIAEAATIQPSEYGESKVLNLARKIWLRKVGILLKGQLHLSSEEILNHRTRDTRIDRLFVCFNELETYYEKLEEDKVKMSISLLLSLVTLLKAKLALRRLLDLNDHVMIACFENELELLLGDVKLFISVLINVKLQRTAEKETTFERIKSFSKRIISLRYSLYFGRNDN
ncbi:OLC1v1007926C1 [Oldenlandia corymbosa var. corymbosa]|uniref:OLC1v1007926C1 n=1 Tax=Oldenlandia corymbosa var. corymbosa TaxID=529605 RepID=A0AAV1DKT6_OLDCO|nr:OLC1v1007926C1 [Oldenlandia corymbosa var. corymbosa]